MYKINTAPASEPITSDQAKTHLKVSGSDEDNLITNLIVAARQHAEKYLRKSLISQTWDLYLDEFEDVNYIFKGPIQSITHVKYYDTSNEEQTWDSSKYDADLVSEPARIIVADGYSYPSLRDKPNAVNIRFVAGYGDAADVPDQILQGMYLYITFLYEHRGDEAYRPPKAVYDLWNDYRTDWL